MLAVGDNIILCLPALRKELEETANDTAVTSSTLGAVENLEVSNERTLVHLNKP